MEMPSGNQLMRQQDTSEPPYVVQKVQLAAQFPCEMTEKIIQAWLGDIADAVEVTGNALLAQQIRQKYCKCSVVRQQWILFKASI